MIKTIYEVCVEDVISEAKANTISFSGFVKHAPKMLRDSMMLSYQRAVDETLKAMDAARVKDPVKHNKEKQVVLLDQNGHAT